MTFKALTTIHVWSLLLENRQQQGHPSFFSAKSLGTEPFFCFRIQHSLKQDSNNASVMEISVHAIIIFVWLR
jgi:hypothetical protein